MKKINRKSCGFTLIELLVVISIIALLISILLPSLNQARAQAKKVRCAVQMKQWLLAASMYSTENKGTLPYFGADRYYPPNSPPHYRGPYWFESLAPFLAVEEDNPDATFTEKEAFAAESRKCPAGKYTNSGPAQSEGSWEGWIGVNFGLGNSNVFPLTTPFYYRKKGGINPPFQVDRVSGAAMTMIFLDVKQTFVYSPLNGGIYKFRVDHSGDGFPDSSPQANVGSAYPYNGARPDIHAGSCNVALLDGHVEGIRFEDFMAVDDRDQVTHPFWYVNY